MKIRGSTPSSLGPSGIIHVLELAFLKTFFLGGGDGDQNDGVEVWLEAAGVGGGAAAAPDHLNAAGGGTADQARVAAF